VTMGNLDNAFVSGSFAKAAEILRSIGNNGVIHCTPKAVIAGGVSESIGNIDIIGNGGSS